VINKAIEFVSGREIVLGEDRFQAFTAVSDFEKSVQKTLNEGNGDKQGSPGFLGRQPAIDIDGLGGIIGG